MPQENRVVNNNQSFPNGFQPGCRRERKDRRQRPTPWLSKYTFIGSRRKNRRKNDQHHNYYVDIYDSKLAKLVVLIFLLCVLDAMLTLFLLGQGASELNPIMDYYLKMGKNYFFIVKSIFTAVGLLVLLMHQNFKRVRKIIKGLCVVYTLLITYQLALLIVSMVS
jgi:hypothetical protein